MLLVIRNEIVREWTIGSEVEPLNISGEVVVVFDPSKTNMACIIGTPTGKILETLEFSGNNRRKGPVQDTTVYCAEVRAFLQEYLKNARVYMVAVEAAITKKGMNHHHSNMVLTEIRGNILNFFQECYGVRPIEVNNWTWKAAILPQGFRSQSEKGSKRYFQTYFPEDPMSNYFEADMTDCFCIFLYVTKKFCAGYALTCNIAEPCNYEYTYAIIPTRLSLELMEASFNERYTLKENLNYFVNRVPEGFTIVVPLSKLEMSTDNLQRCKYFELQDIDCTEVRLYVRRV